MPDPARRRTCIALGAAALAWSRVLAAPAVPAAGRVLSVEGAGARLALRSGDDLRLLHELPSRHPLRGPPQATRDGRLACFISADGWLTLVDLQGPSVQAQVEVGRHASTFSLSADGHWVLVAAAPATLSLFDGRLQRVHDYVVASRDGTKAGVSAICESPPRKSFVVTLHGVPELWEISLDPAAPPIFDGLVHDYRMGEGIGRPGYLGIRRTPLDQPVDLVAMDNPGRHALVLARAPPGAEPDSALMQVINLDVRRALAQWGRHDAAARAGSTAFEAGERALLAIADRSHGGVDIIDTSGWKSVGRLAGVPGRVVVRTHPRAAHLWVARLPDEGEQVISIVDKHTLAPAGRVMLGATRLWDIAFTADGAKVVAAGREGKGAALIAFDVRSQAEMVRVATDEPVSLIPLLGG